MERENGIGKWNVTCVTKKTHRNINFLFRNFDIVFKLFTKCKIKKNNNNKVPQGQTWFFFLTWLKNLEENKKGNITTMLRSPTISCRMQTTMIGHANRPYSITAI